MLFISRYISLFLLVVFIDRCSPHPSTEPMPQDTAIGG